MQIKMLSEYPLLNRMLIYIFLFATGATALVTFANLHSEYSRQLNAIETHLDTLEASQLNSLANNLWTVNKDSLEIQLNSILQHPDIISEEIVYPDGAIFSVGRKSLSTEQYLVKEFDINFNDYGKKIYLGKFRVYASTENIQDYLYDRLPMMIASNIIVITFVCGFILFLFIKLFNRHFNLIVNFTKTLDLNTLDNRLHLKRKQRDESQHPDELERIVNAINEMRLRLKDGILQRENAESVLRESEEKFRMIFSNSPLAILHLDKHGIIKTCNDNLSRILGAPPDKLMGFDTLKSVKDEVMRSAISESLSGRDGHYEGNYLSVNGGITTPIQARFGPLLTSDGSIIGAIGVFIDITERKQSEEAMKKFQSAVAASTDAIGMSTADGRHYYQNDAFNCMFGKISEDPPTSLYVDESVGREVFRTIMSGEQWIGEVKMHGSDNNIMDILLRAYALKDEDGRIVNLVGVHTDITEQKLSEINLATEKERLAITLRSIGDGVITTDVSGNIILLNKVAEQLTGWSQEEAVGRPLNEVFHIISELTGELCENPVTKVISSSQTIDLAAHTVLVARDGIERRIADSGAPILDAESNIIGVVLVFRDVTEQIKIEKELLKVKKLESIGVLAGGIAHDFNNILTSILGNINLVLFDTSLDGKTIELLKAAEKASIRAKDLTQQLLTFAKGGEPVKEVSSLENVIKDSADFVLHGDKIACHYDIPEDLWLVDIDKGQMSQVIQNIVLNASHAMPEGGTIRISCENIPSCDNLQGLALQTRGLKICLQDNGIGMPSNVVEKIFDPYYSTKNEGSGLGLAISQSIINKHHGNISVESSPGVGTLFTIYLPASEKIKIQKQESSAENKASSRAKILIMDDDEMLLDMAKEMLVALGHEAVLAENGEKAVELYQESVNSGKLFHMVIMDLTVPGGMGGKDAVRKVLNINPDARVIVSSGYSNDPVMANYKDFGFCSTIIKPYRLQDLSDVISQVLER